MEEKLFKGIKNNKVIISGTILQEMKLNYEKLGEKFFEYMVQVERLSGAYDILPIMISERLIVNRDMTTGDEINIIGQLRSYNRIVDGKSKLILMIFAQAFLEEKPKNPNEIFLNGYICKPTNYRTTPLNREIADLLIAVNRDYKKSDYVPCIAWGRNARFVKEIKVGDKISLCGRIQSREYQKKLSETETKTMTAYEVSISSLSVGEWED